MLTNLIAASALGNYPLISPVALKAFIDTGGLSAVRGVRALILGMSFPAQCRTVPLAAGRSADAG